MPGSPPGPLIRLPASAADGLDELRLLGGDRVVVVRLDRITRDGSAARNPTGNTVPSVIGTSPISSPGLRSPTTRGIPSTSFTTSIWPSSKANSARPSPSCAAYSPAARLMSAAARARRSRLSGLRAAK